MKISKLSNKILKKMVKNYIKTGLETLSFEDACSMFPDVPEHLVNSSLTKLNNDNLINVQYADDVAYLSVLNIDGIIYTEENTLIKKGYNTIKEIKNLLN